MSGSYVTKKALANALQELMTEKSFEKISVSEICERCNMNRKSLYYHFSDKYDLLNWIFDEDFDDVVNSKIKVVCGSDEHWLQIESILNRFYQKRSFYRRAIQTSGQNSFPEHFKERIRPLLKGNLEIILGMENADDFYVDFFTDAFFCSIERWLLVKDCLPVRDFVAKTRYLIVSMGKAITEKNKVLNI